MPRSARGWDGAHAVSSRVDDGVVRALDALVDVGIHGTRAAAAVWLLRAGITAQRALLERVSPLASAVRRERARVLACGETSPATLRPSSVAEA